MYTDVIAALFIIAKKEKQPKCPRTNYWINKRGIHAIEYYLVIKRNEVHATIWMKLENIMLSERSKT